MQNRAPRRRGHVEAVKLIRPMGMAPGTRRLPAAVDAVIERAIDRAGHVGVFFKKHLAAPIVFIRRGAPTGPG
jgi:hypothetical protein